jgi:hypothetical protein
MSHFLRRDRTPYLHTTFESYARRLEKEERLRTRRFVISKVWDKKSSKRTSANQEDSSLLENLMEAMRFAHRTGRMSSATVSLSAE